MQVTAEGQRTRYVGLAVIWLIVAALLYAHAALFRGYIDELDRVGVRGGTSAGTPLKRICPTAYADTQMWTRHALALEHGAGPQLRYTDVDNAPFGREVHWDSGLAWTIAAAGWLQHVVTGEPLTFATEHALAWINLPLLLGVVVVFTLWISKRAGLGAAAVVAFFILGEPDFYVGFAPNYVDHHGLLAASVFGLFLGVIFMGLGFCLCGRAARSEQSASCGWSDPPPPSQGQVTSPTSNQPGESIPPTEPLLNSASLLPNSYVIARSGALLSAVSGAVGMWISAATLIPAIAITGLAATVCILIFARRNPPVGGGGVPRVPGLAMPRVVFDPHVWRLWGVVGAAMSGAFYLLEYAPAHLGFRLEVNHPVYAFAWWGGSELIAQVGEWRCGSAKRSGGGLIRLIVALLALALPAVIIALAGERVFVVFDPFVTRLSAFVLEGLSFLSTIQTTGWIPMLVKVPSLLATVAFAVVLVWRASAYERAVAWFAILVYLASLAMALAQGRWWPTASSASIALIVSGLALLVRRRSPRGQWGWVITLSLLVCAPVIAVRTYAQAVETRRHLVDPTDAIQPLYRDIAAQIRASHPEGDVVLLASPNASAAISYYGEFKSIGTLYWENLAGTKAAAEMFSAQSETEARRLLRARGVTHVAMISDTNFLGEYFSLRYPHPTSERLENSFGYQLLVQQQVPLWLEQVPYEVPRDIPMGDVRVLLFATKFSNDRAESLYESAVADVDAGRLADAERTLDQALALAPRSSEFWVIKAHLVFARGDVSGAFDAVRHAIDAASPVQVYPICTGEAPRFYQARAHGAAAELYRVALKIQFDPTIANNLAWILATSPDDEVRNGREALALVEPMAHDRSDFLTLSSYAAALAETGRYNDAVAVARRAIDAARAVNNDALVRKAQACETAYAHRQPWRE